MVRERGGRVRVVGFVYMYTRLKPHGAFSQKRQIHTVEGTRWSLATSLRSTELPINSSCMAKRTGSRVLLSVAVLDRNKPDKSLYSS
jgi:hypothetical protein